MMAPAATAAASGAKVGAIDAASLFAADKAAATEAQVALAATAKKDGVAALAGLSDAVVKVSIHRFRCIAHGGDVEFCKIELWLTNFRLSVTRRTLPSVRPLPRRSRPSARTAPASTSSLTLSRPPPAPSSRPSLRPLPTRTRPSRRLPLTLSRLLFRP